QPGLTPWGRRFVDGMARQAAPWADDEVPAEALVRTRHGVGDGSDRGRIQLQQTFIKALIHRAESIDVHLPHPAARRPTALSPLGRPPRRPSALLQRRAPQLISPGRAPSPFNDWVAAFR
ncbi:LCP family protein, partial [Streptomyces sp. NPDC005373]|uniref:LCP family glycopolymer transferase n=1 Tax=Streptomyces sp. NPDC005373 TaxID=3156879 RepID=UPI0033A681B9